MCLLSSVSLLCSVCVQVCMQMCVCIHEHIHVWACGSTTQWVALPHQPSSDRPNIAQRRQLLPLLSCLAPIHSIIPHSAAHIHPLFPCLFSKDTSSLAKYMLVIIFHCKRFKDTSQGWLAHCWKQLIKQTKRHFSHKLNGENISISASLNLQPVNYNYFL